MNIKSLKIYIEPTLSENGFYNLRVETTVIGRHSALSHASSVTLHEDDFTSRFGLIVQYVLGEIERLVGEQKKKEKDDPPIPA